MMRVMLHINIRTSIGNETGNAKIRDNHYMINEDSLTNDMIHDTTHDDMMSAMMPNDIIIATTPINHFITRIHQL